MPTAKWFFGFDLFSPSKAARAVAGVSSFDAGP
jgi:hypothetical protein